MSEFRLTPKPALSVGALDANGIRLTLQSELNIVSIAVAGKNQSRLAASVQRHLHLALPEVGHSSFNQTTGARLLATAPNQWFLMQPGANDLATHDLKTQLGDSAYLTNQSDSWVTLQMSGPNCREALARLCSLDLHPDKYPVGATSRTLMEHLGVIICRTESDSFTLLSARSSAQSFWQTISEAVTGLPPSNDNQTAA